MEGTIEGQTERIVSLEEEVATLRWRKECKCSEMIIATGLGEGESSELEYVEEEGGDGLESSYHSPIVAQEEVPLLVFGEALPGDTQSLPVEVQETCGCPVPTVVRIEDDIKMVAVPRENNTPIPVPSRYTVCHDLVSFLLQILQVINELHDLTTFFLILSYLSHFLSFHYLIKGKTT